MKLIEIMKGWILIALGFAGVVAVAFWGLGISEITIQTAIHRICIIIISFAVVLVSGSLWERKVRNSNKNKKEVKNR